MKNNIPHEFIKGQTEVISDDWKAQNIMLQLGVWKYFAGEVGSASSLTMGVAENHPTHWCLCSRHRNNLVRKKNGFQVIAFPKETMNEATVRAIMFQQIEVSSEVDVEIVTPGDQD